MEELALEAKEQTANPEKHRGRIPAAPTTSHFTSPINMVRSSNQMPDHVSKGALNLVKEMATGMETTEKTSQPQPGTSSHPMDQTDSSQQRIPETSHSSELYRLLTEQEKPEEKKSSKGKKMKKN